MLKALSILRSKRPRNRWLANAQAGFARRDIARSFRHRDRKARLAHTVIEMSDQMQGLSDQQLLDLSRNQKSTAHCDADLDSILPKAFALVREVSRRVHGQAHYQVQIAAGIALFHGAVAQMQTGEGKTLAALLPAYLYSLIGKGVHVVTANDYLAQRDAEFAKPVFERLEISVGCLFDGLERKQRRPEYDCDITYGTAREFGFDHLKDRLAGGAKQNNLAENLAVVQRGHYFALVDEADSVMIDDARTPLLIAAPGEEDGFRQDMVGACHAASLALQQHTEFELSHDHRSATLTKRGCLGAMKIVDARFIHGFGTQEIYRQVENSLTANHLFSINRHYVVTDGEVAIVDESTGRIADGRKWQNGLHQAIEAKEAVEITSDTQTLAKITVQSYFRNYRHLAGLTGTAIQVAREFKKVYDLQVVTIPTRLESRRRGYPECIFARDEEKAEAIASATMERLKAGQAVLIGSPSVRASQRISEMLTKFKIVHNVLNCLEHESESRIVANAGAAGRVTVATNMAGRGTDIRVDPAVQQNGGLHIIATAKHTSSRIDRQLIGRTARQGESGSYQFILSLEDELFAIAGEQPNRRSATRRSTTNPYRGISLREIVFPSAKQPTKLESIYTSPAELPASSVSSFNQTQSKIEKLHEKQRLNLLEHEKKRNKLCLQMGLDPCLEMLDE